MSQPLPIIIAAGGLVTNSNQELLMIFRREKWDLPKGKLDPNEDILTCAIREVTEETGVTPLTINNFYHITYHDYFDTWQQQNVRKATHWYGMTTIGEPTLLPQTEEDITAVAWVPVSEIDTKLNNTYPNIVEVVTKWLQHHALQQQL